jgi:hypothetical protein
MGSVSNAMVGSVFVSVILYTSFIVEISCVNEACIAGSDIPPVFVFCCCFFFLISDHFIQKPCYLITLCSPGELHRGPRGLHNSFDQGKYQIE